MCLQRPTYCFYFFVSSVRIYAQRSNKPTKFLSISSKWQPFCFHASLFFREHQFFDVVAKCVAIFAFLKTQYTTNANSNGKLNNIVWLFFSFFSLRAEIFVDAQLRRNGNQTSRRNIYYEHTIHIYIYIICAIFGRGCSLFQSISRKSAHTFHI